MGSGEASVEVKVVAKSCCGWCDTRKHVSEIFLMDPSRMSVILGKYEEGGR